jgi:competence protein ComEC
MFDWNKIIQTKIRQMKKATVLIACLLFFASRNTVLAQDANVMRVHYINIGQGAAVLLEFPCGAMLIDAGAQDATYHAKLISYLTDFFTKRKDLNNTLDLVMVTHPHLDHNEALADVAKTFKIKRYIDDGMRTGSGRKNQKMLQDSASAWQIKYASYTYESITTHDNIKGLTNDMIDPIQCKNGDPKIYMYSSRFDAQPDAWSKTDYDNANNQSLVVKVLFGKASFLFTGDMETKGLETIVNKYGASKALNADVLMVGHHGADNATTDEYLDAVAPKYAVISCGPWDDGKEPHKTFSTYSYGHPRISTVEMLEKHIVKKRLSVVHVKAGVKSKEFKDIDVTKCVYATPWDGNVVVTATTDAKYTVRTGK